MKFWQSISYNTPEDCVAIAEVAEQAGYSGVSFAEHIFYPLNLQSRYLYSEDASPHFEIHALWPEMWTTITAMAMKTSRLRFASAVNILPLHNPFELAKTLATVARLSQNRVAIGTGAGWMKEEFDAFGVDFSRRGKRYDEAMALMRLLWSGQPVSYQGQHFQCEQALMLPPPEKPVPFWIGGKSEAALRRAAYQGDGWLGTGEPLEETLTLVARLQELRKQAGRDHLPFDIVAIQPFAILNDDNVRQMADLGVTDIKNWTFSFVMDAYVKEGREATLIEKQDYLLDQQALIRAYGD